MAYHPFRHLGLKILAIALAILLWLTVAGEQVVERALHVPLQLQNKPEHLEIVGEPPAAVDVLVRGSSAVLSRLEPGEVVMVVDLSGARPGSRLFPLGPSQVKVPFGVEVAQVMPGTLALELERSLRRTVPVVPAVEGEPAPGFVVGARRANPATVEVAGPESRVKQLTEATTEPVRIDGAREPVRDVVTVGVADASVRLVQARTAQVVVEIVPAPVEHEFPNVPVRWRNLASHLRATVRPSVVRVEVRGAQEAIETLEPGAIEAFVDLAGVGPGRYNLQVQVEPSEAFGVSAITPATVDVIIR